MTTVELSVELLAAMRAGDGIALLAYADLAEEQYGTCHQQMLADFGPWMDLDDRFGDLSEAHIRWFIRHDMSDAITIDRQSFASPIGEEGLTATLRAQSIGMVAEATWHECLVFGFMIYNLHEDHIFLNRFAVHPLARRRGVGRALMARLQQKLTTFRQTRLVVQFDLVSGSCDPRGAEDFLYACGFERDAAGDFVFDIAS
jgi:GNAT superfamily N-acetyltransferase